MYNIISLLLPSASSEAWGCHSPSRQRFHRNTEVISVSVTYLQPRVHVLLQPGLGFLSDNNNTANQSQPAGVCVCGPSSGKHWLTMDPSTKERGGLLTFSPRGLSVCLFKEEEVLYYWFIKKKKVQYNIQNWYYE